nr:hypothetical protein [Lachnospiraceae bacterium]
MIKKKLPALAMILSLVLCGCAGGSTETVSSVTSVSEIPPASVSSVSSKESDTRTGTDPVPKTSVSETPDPEEYSVAEKILSEMTLEEKAAQMTIVAFDIFNEDVSACFSELKPGGVILFSKNFTSEEDLGKLTGELSENSKRSGIPAFISIDQEGGTVQRIRFSGDYPKASEIGAGGDEAYAYDNGLKIGKELASYGINLDFAPVMDVNSNPNNPVIGNRSFSDNPETVSKMGIAT